MKKGETVPLQEVCNVEYGKRVVRKRDSGSVYPVYGGGGETCKMDEFNREDRLVVARFGMSEECTRFVAGRFFLNDSGLTVSPKTGGLLQRFIDYQMLAKNDEIYLLGKGAAQKNLTVPLFRTLPIFVPKDTEEQQRIVDVLDAAFDGIATVTATAEVNLRNARAVFDRQRDDRIERRFLYYFMMSDGFLKNIKKSATGTMVKHTAPKRILSNRIPFPSDRKEQRRLIKKLDSLREETQRLESRRLNGSPAFGALYPIGRGSKGRSTPRCEACLRRPVNPPSIAHFVGSASESVSFAKRRDFPRRR